MYHFACHFTIYPPKKQHNKILECCLNMGIICKASFEGKLETLNSVNFTRWIPNYSSGRRSQSDGVCMNRDSVSRKSIPYIDISEKVYS